MIKICFNTYIIIFLQYFRCFVIQLAVRGIRKMAKEKNIKKNKKKNNRSQAAFIIAAAVIIVIAAAVLIHTGSMQYKLKKAGYSADEIKRIESAFTKEEQQILAANKAQAGILEMVSDDRFQQDKLEDYLKALSEGKEPYVLLDDFDPWVISLRATEGYRDEFLDNYLRVYPKEGLADASYVVSYINRSYDLIEIEGYNVQFAGKYEARYLQDPSSSYEEIVRYVNLSELYSGQNCFISSNLERYDAYSKANPELELPEVISRVNAGIDRPFYTDIQPADMSQGYLVLVNKYFTVEKDYKPELADLSGYGTGSLEKTAAEWFKKMVDAAREDGISLRSVSPFRTWETQNSLYTGYVSRAGQAAADTYSARPGHSEHETGLAVDINTASVAAHFENTAEYEWLINNCYKFGFILRYPKGKDYLTGYIYEPWHYRYVGTDHAQEIMESGLTYEEWYACYIDKQN